MGRVALSSSIVVLARQIRHYQHLLHRARPQTVRRYRRAIELRVIRIQQLIQQQ